MIITQELQDLFMRFQYMAEQAHKPHGGHITTCPEPMCRGNVEAIVGVNRRQAADLAVCKSVVHLPSLDSEPTDHYLEPVVSHNTKRGA